MSTANKLTYLNGTKQAIKQAINEDFEVIDDNTTFREYADEISSNNAKYKDLIPKETTNATNTLDISNSSGLDKALVTQYGNTYQETTTGKNKLNVNADTFLRNGITSSTLNQTITFNGTTTDTWSSSGLNDCFLEANKSYIFSISNSNTPSEVRFRMWGYENETSTISINKMNNEIFIPSTNITKVRVVCENMTTNKNYNFEVKCQIEENTTVTEYEEYTGGNPAPNPDYPQEIVNISGKSTLKDINQNIIGELETGNISENDGTDISNSYRKRSDFILAESNTKYTLGVSTPPQAMYLIFHYYDKNKNYISNNPIVTSTGIVSDTTPSNCKFIRVVIANTQSFSVNNCQLLKGEYTTETIPDYEPYKEQSFDLDLKSKNLFDKNNASIFQGYLNNNSVISRSDTATTIYIPCKPNTTYTVQKTIGTNNRFCVFTTTDVPVGGNSALNYVGTRVGADDNTNYTITTPSQANYLCAFIGVKTTTPTISEIIASIQIEKSSTPTEYEPYYNINLCEIDNYKDRIYPLNGKWYLEKFSEKVTIDGTNIDVTNRRETNTSGNYTFIFLFSKKAKRADGTITQGGYCDKLVSKPRNNIYGRTQGFGYGATNNDYWGDIVIFRTDWATKTITDVNTDLKSNPIELEYLLDSAETIEITESNYPTLYNQLNNIKLFEGVNHITMTNESGLDVEFDIEYYKDWKLD